MTMSQKVVNLRKESIIQRIREDERIGRGNSHHARGTRMHRFSGRVWGSSQNVYLDVKFDRNTCYRSFLLFQSMAVFLNKFNGFKALLQLSSTLFQGLPVAVLSFWLFFFKCKMNVMLSFIFVQNMFVLCSLQSWLWCNLNFAYSDL